MCCRTGKYTVCRRVRASFSPEILQDGAVKGLREMKSKTFGPELMERTVQMFILSACFIRLFYQYLYKNSTVLVCFRCYFALYQWRAEKRKTGSWRTRYFCYTFLPCLWRHLRRLLITKWQRPQSCFYNIQTSMSNKQDEQSSEKLPSVQFIFHFYRLGPWCLFASVPL